MGKGVSIFTQTFNKFFIIEKQKALGNTNKAVKDLNSTPSFNFVLKSMRNFKRLGDFEDQTGGKKSLIWLGKQPLFGLYKEGFCGPAKRINLALILNEIIPFVSVTNSLFNIQNLNCQ
jgi:hypothetical protein